MSEPVRFLTSLSHALATLGLYGDGHPATTRAADAAHRQLADLQAASPRVEFTFLPGEVLFGRELLPELENWEWSTRLAQGGIERLEVTGPVEPEQFERFLSRAAAILGLRPDAGVDLWQAGSSAIRFGRVRVDDGRAEVATAPLTIATLGYSLLKNPANPSSERLSSGRRSATLWPSAGSTEDDPPVLDPRTSFRTPILTQTRSRREVATFPPTPVCVQLRSHAPAMRHGLGRRMSCAP